MTVEKYGKFVFGAVWFTTSPAQLKGGKQKPSLPRKVLRRRNGRTTVVRDEPKE
jgi:hypothetical protein